MQVQGKAIVVTGGGGIIIDGIENDRLHIVVGRDARMMNVADRVAPKRSTHLIQKQMKELLS